MYTEEDIKIAVSNLEKRGLAKIVRHYYGFIILAQSEDDFRGKCKCIDNDDSFGFYTVERAKDLK